MMICSSEWKGYREREGGREGREGREGKEKRGGKIQKGPEKKRTSLKQVGKTFSWAQPLLGHDPALGET